MMPEDFGFGFRLVMSGRTPVTGQVTGRSSARRRSSHVSCLYSTVSGAMSARNSHTFPISGPRSMVIVLMGASAAGKTTVGRQLSEELRWLFLDGDEVHPLENITKMGRGTPLTDEDRRPWIQALRRSIAEWLEQGMNAVLTGSLLMHAHRAAVLGGYEPHVKLAYLQASRALLR